MTMRICGVELTPFMLSVAARLAHMDSETQAAFFNAFAKELLTICGTKQQAQMQAVYVMEQASKEFIEFCAMICYKEGDE